MSDKPEKVRGIFYDDVNSKHSSTRVLAIGIGCVGIILIIVYGFAGKQPLLTAGNALLEVAKWLFTAIVLRSTVIQSVRSWGWGSGSSTTTATIPQSSQAQAPQPPPTNASSNPDTK